MGYTFKIRGRYWRPLGTVENVQQEIAKAFPSAAFFVQEDPKLLSRAERIRAVSLIRIGAASPAAVGPLRLILGLALRSIFRLALLLHAVKPPKYPYFIGNVQGAGYMVDFFLGSETIVRKMYVTFYGSDWEMPGRQCDQLITNTGWVLKP